MGRRQENRRLRAVVVGAGFAGLAAADALVRAGVEVIAFEARDRVGGRVWSHRLANGAVVEMGAEFLLPADGVVADLARRFGLGLWLKGMSYGDREPRGAIGVDRASLLAAFEVAGRALAMRPADAPSLSAASFLAGLEVDEGAREAILARLEISSANDADAVDAGVLQGIAGHSEDESASIAMGNQRIALALAGELGDAVHLRSPVEGVGWSDTGVRVRARAGEVQGDVCVVSVPATVLDEIAFDPPLPDWKARALRRVPYGHAAKLFVPLLEPAPPSAVLSVPERYWTWTAKGGGGTVQPVVHAFAGSRPALARLGVDDGPERWVESLARLRPDLVLDPSDAVLATWDDDPWARAAYSTPAPGGRTTDELAHPVGPLYFCGEHTAGPLAALMEGAVRSGLRAAGEILRAAGSRPRATARG